MRFGRAGAISAAHRARRERPPSAASNHGQQQISLSHDEKPAEDPEIGGPPSAEVEEDAEDEGIIQIQDIDLKENTRNRIVFRKYPFALWIVGCLVFVCALYLLYHVALGSLGVLFHGYREGYWWQYLIVVGLIALAFLFIYAGKIESVTFDR